MRSDRLRVRGFTIVELLIVIVVIAILAAITMIAYNGMQERAKDTRRKNDISQIKKALLAYDIVHGGVVHTYAYTDYGSGPTYGGWDHSAGTNWLAFLHKEYSKMPVDPKNIIENTVDATATENHVYSYYCYPAYEVGGIGHPDSASVTLVYRTESESAVTDRFLVTSCLTAVP